jgi:hypothetical protein
MRVALYRHMRATMVLAVLSAISGCTFDISLGPNDGIAQVRYEAKVGRAAFAQGGTVVLERDIVIVSAEQSSDYLRRFGADKLDALTGVELELVEAHVEGGAFLGSPVFSLAGATMSGPGDRVTMSDDFVDELRDRILAGQEMVTPGRITLQVADTGSSLATWPASVNIVVVVQPTLHVDAYKTL